jgi:mannose-1-phosphate guanylyltransferase
MDYVVIMAGGTGKRLWPLSRKKRPKQVLKLLDGQTLLRKCFQRLIPVFDARNIIVLTNAGYADIVRENLPEVPYNNVIAEPLVRDTAGAVGLAAAILTKYDADATMAVVTADQLIEPDVVFQQALEDALYFINKNPDCLITFGIKPAFAATQYGYIKCSKPSAVTGCENKVSTVEAFKEKPDAETAINYLESGQFLWNSGMFVWKAKTILSCLQKFLPDATEPLKNIHAAWDGPAQQTALLEWFATIPKISIDFAVMEKAEKVHAIQLDCRWLDLGSFVALADIISSDENNNIVIADYSELLDCKDSIFVTEEKGHLIAAVGLDNIVVAHSPDATLVCRSDRMDKIKELLELIEKNTGEKFL